MKSYNITAISDTHSKHTMLNGKLPGGDILIHAGDFTFSGKQYEAESFVNWFSKQDYRYKVFIAGNHDDIMESERAEEIISKLPNNVFYLENDGIVLDGIKIWGSPNTPPYGTGVAFNLSRGYLLNRTYSSIPDDADIVITHVPLYGYNDYSHTNQQHVGSIELYYRFSKINPHLHICGHIHESYGNSIVKTTAGIIESINASIWNHFTDSINNPINFEYNFETKSIKYTL